MATDGTTIYLANTYGPEDVVALNATTGAIRWTATKRAAHFDTPSALAVEGGLVWVTNSNTTGSVSVLHASSGQLWKVVR